MLAAELAFCDLHSARTNYIRSCNVRVVLSHVSHLLFLQHPAKKLNYPNIFYYWLVKKCMHGKFVIDS